MRRLLSVALIAGTLGGCERFAARSDIAAEVGAHQLTAERVSEIMTKSGGGPTLQAAEFISNLWLDYSLFARAVADDAIPSDSTELDQVLWPTLSTIKINLWRDTVRAQRAKLTPAAIDSAFNGDEFRVFQHIIVQPAGQTAADTAAARRKIAGVLARARSGANFGQLAAENSGDGSRNDQGYLPFGPRGQFVPEFEDPAWGLAPGEISDVITTSFGFHVIRRPPLSEARVRVEKGLADRLGAKTDSAYFADLKTASGLKVAGGAAAAIKNAAAYPETARNSSKTLVSLKGGDVTAGDFVKWAAMFPLQNKMQIRNANDTMLAVFAEDLGLRTLLLRAADSAGIRVEPQMRQFAHLRLGQMINEITEVLGLSVPELSDSSKLSKTEKAKLASDKVEEFFARLLDGRAQMVVLPPELAEIVNMIPL